MQKTCVLKECGYDITSTEARAAAVNKRIGVFLKLGLIIQNLKKNFYTICLYFNQKAAGILH